MSDFKPFIDFGDKMPNLLCHFNLSPFDQPNLVKNAVW